MASHSYPHSEHTCSALARRSPKALSPGARCYQLLLRELLLREKEPSRSGRQEHWQSGIYCRLPKRPQRFCEAGKKFWGQIYIQIKPGNGWLICLIGLKSLKTHHFSGFWSGFKEFSIGKGFVLNCCGAGMEILSLICTEKSLTLLFLPPTFPFQQERWKKKQEKEVKEDDFFQTKENFKSPKIFEQK